MRMFEILKYGDDKVYRHYCYQEARTFGSAEFLFRLDYDRPGKYRIVSQKNAVRYFTIKKHGLGNFSIRAELDLTKLQY